MNYGVETLWDYIFQRGYTAAGPSMLALA